MECKIFDCKKDVDHPSKGFCHKHYMRWYRHGDPLHLERLPNGSGYICKRYGYKFITVNGKQIREHRYLMEKSIGRPLTDNEEVHHINENKFDNRIENMQILTKARHTSLHNRKCFIGEKGRECTVCGKIKPYTDYWRDSSQTTGHESRCKICHP